MTDTLKIGSSIPSFNLLGIDGKHYSTDNYKEVNGLIVVFSCNHCPYVQAYEERIKKIQSDYFSKGIQVIAINSNDPVSYPGDSYVNMKLRGKEQQFNFPYLWDETQDIARAFGATHTPEIFLFNEQRKLVFHGKIDDNWNDEKSIKNKYLRNALDEMLSGTEISVPETFTIGCTIKWK